MLSILFLQSFSWAVQDGIIPLNNHASTLDFYQDHLHTLRDHLDKPLDLFPLRSLPASTTLQSSFAGVTAVIPLQGDLLYYRNHSTTRKLRASNRESMNKLMLTSQESGRLHSGNLISCHCSTRWLLPRLSLIELRISPIALSPRLAVAFICRALRFVSTPPPLARKALICKYFFFASWQSSDTACSTTAL